MRIREAIRRDCPEILAEAGVFPVEMTLDIGFYNPESCVYTGDRLANDETELSAESLSELEELYGIFCKENDLPVDTVEYVIVAETGSEKC